MLNAGFQLPFSLFSLEPYSTIWCYPHSEEILSLISPVYKLPQPSAQRFVSYVILDLVELAMNNDPSMAARS